MRGLVMICGVVVCLPVLLAGPKNQLQWNKATVVHVRRELSTAGDVAALGISQSVREQLDLDAGDVTYRVEEWVVPRQRLQLQEGTSVQFAIDGKKVVLKTADGKTRKMKLVARYPKSGRNDTVTPKFPAARGCTIRWRRICGRHLFRV